MGKKEIRKSFLMYADQESVFEKLSGNECKELMMCMFHYHRGEEVHPSNRMIEILFEPIRLQMDRDNEKYDRTIKARREAGQKGAEARRVKDGISPFVY